MRAGYAPTHASSPSPQTATITTPRHHTCTHVFLQTGKVLGCQATGLVDGVEKRVDVVSMCMQVRDLWVGGALL